MTTVIHPERASAYARGKLAEQLVGTAAELAFVVRDQDRGGIREWLDARGIAAGDDGARALLVVLAALVPVDVTPGQMLSWVTWDEYGCPLPAAVTGPPAAAAQPLAPAARVYADCGTRAAYWRHKRAGHPREQIEACGCGEAGRDYYQARYAAKQGGQVAGAARKGKTEGRIEDYAERRQKGDSISEAAGRLGISLRTARRYEAKLKAREEISDAA